MLRPNKHSHPDRTVINVALLMLIHLRNRRVEEYEKLRSLAKTRVPGGEFLFLPALNFLFLMGRINYLPKIDAFEFKEHNNETV